MQIQHIHTISNTYLIISIYLEYHVSNFCNIEGLRSFIVLQQEGHCWVVFNESLQHP
jgi:hypothetical protein